MTFETSQEVKITKDPVKLRVGGALFTVVKDHDGALLIRAYEPFGPMRIEPHATNTIRIWTGG